MFSAKRAGKRRALDEEEEERRREVEEKYGIDGSRRNVRLLSPVNPSPCRNHTDAVCNAQVTVGLETAPAPPAATAPPAEPEAAPAADAPSAQPKRLKVKFGGAGAPSASMT